MIVAIGLLVALFLSARGLAGFYTDYLWFDSIGRGDTWRSLLWARFAPAAVFTVTFFAMMLISLTIADRLAPRTRALGPEDEMLARYQETVGPYAGRIRIAVSLVFALLAGASVAGEWQRWILFTNAQDFGVKDPQFHRDVGFYVFRLPFLTFVFDWLFAGLIIVLIVTTIAHYLNGGIRLQTPFQKVTPQVKAHLSVILAIMALVKTAQYFYARYELNFSTRGFVEGASKTDVAAELPSLNLLMVISVVAAGLFVWNIWRRGWVLPVIAVGLWGFVALVIGTVVPAIYQQFFVNPNELAKEKPYIARNIEATRAAFGLVEGEDITSTPFDYRTNLNQQDLVDNSQTIDNARLWDHDAIEKDYQQFQSLQTYYKFVNADTDRYIVDGQLRQVLIAARELNRADLPSQSWVNRHVVYTHGYGAVVSPANTAESGQPTYFLKDIPGEGKIALDRPQLYFGEGLDGYSLVGAKQREFDFPARGVDATTRYKGDAGVGLSSLVRRAAFALRFGDQNLLISTQIQDSSKIIFRRDIRERVETAAPFLKFDQDPYPVITDGHLVWVLDGYTTSDHYPYAQHLSPSEGVLAGERFNYVRNSVKATVDAYDGTIRFYVADPSDPVLKAYRAAFPDLFSALSTMPKEVRAHLRYPQDLFRYQTDVYRTYHVTSPTTFFAGANAWEVSADPATAGLAGGTSTLTQVPQNASSSGQRIEPLYVLTRLPGQTREEFLIIRPFVPVSKGDGQNRLSAFMVAHADPNASPRLESFEMPTGLTVAGPVQVDRTINNTDEISQRISLLDQQGSLVQQGSLQIIPVEDSLLYIQPLYVLSESGDQPALRFVIVYYDEEAHLGDTLQEALLKFPAFAGGAGASADPTTPSTTAPPNESTPGTDLDALLSQAESVNREIQAALADGDLGKYQQKVAELGDLLEQIIAANGGSSGTAPTATTSTTTRPSRGDPGARRSPLSPGVASVTRHRRMLRGIVTISVVEIPGCRSGPVSRRSECSPWPMTSISANTNSAGTTRPTTTSPPRTRG